LGWSPTALRECGESLRRFLEGFGMKRERIDRGVGRLVRAYKASRLMQATLLHGDS